MTVSIIMPLYNAARYLEECIQSVLRQTLADFELICVNDASDDLTVQIVQSFQEKDNRVKLLSNERRRGAAFSRNRGIKEAKGKYLAFLDGDDLFDETMLEKAYDKIEEQEADIVIFEFRHMPSTDIHRKLQVRHSEGFRNRYCRESFCVADCEPYELIIWGSGPWNKLYRRAFIESNQLTFQDLPSANDVYFVNMALMLADKLIALESERVMVYLRDHYEAGRISNNRDPMCNFNAMMQIGRELVKRGKLEKLCSCFYYRVFFSLQSALTADRNEARVQNFYRFLQEEGIRKLCSLDKSYDTVTDLYVRKELEQFKVQSFTSEWYQRKNILSVYLEQKADQVIGLFEGYQRAGKKIAVWGAGENGETLLQFCRQNRLQIAAVIDRSPEMRGRCLCDYTVSMPQDVVKRIEVIIVSARYIRDDVVREAGKEAEEVIDINQFLCLY